MPKLWPILLKSLSFGLKTCSVGRGILFTGRCVQAHLHECDKAPVAPVVESLSDLPFCSFTSRQLVSYSLYMHSFCVQNYCELNHKLMCMLEQWGGELLQGAPGGVLRNRHETYKAAEEMMASLGDRYSQFLPPSQVRCPHLWRVLS